MCHTLYIKNELSELARLYDFIDQHVAPCIANKQTVAQVKLAIEELVTNIILYAYGEQKNQTIQIEMECQGKRLKITVTDSGIPFNPLEKKDPDLSLSLEDRPIGGLGIFLVKQLMNEVYYERSSEKNIFTMIKDLS